MLTPLHFSDKQAEDRPKSPAAASTIDRVLQETPQQEVDKSTKGATATTRGILNCQTVLVVGSLVLEYSYFLSSSYLTCTLMTGSS